MVNSKKYSAHNFTFKFRIHYLQHESYESLGCIEDWVNQNGYSLSSTKFFDDKKLPNINDFEFLIIMGGPMGVHDEDKYSWLKEEKEFIKESIKNNKLVLGICLGSQLLADALGAKVYSNKFKEIGHFPISIKNNHDLFSGFPHKAEVFHWHGDTFDLPDGAVHIAESEACRNQAFVFNNRFVGLQFHLEFTEKSLKDLIANGREELIKNEYTQTEDEILKNIKILEDTNKLMSRMLDRMVEKFNY